LSKTDLIQAMDFSEVMVWVGGGGVKYFAVSIHTSDQF
jgi:hypothetical protein